MKMWSIILIANLSPLAAGAVLAQAPIVKPVAVVAPPQMPAQLPPTYGEPIRGDLAQKIMSAAEAEATKNNWRLTFAIVDISGNLVMFKMMPNANFITREMAIRKARTAAAFRVSTKSLADAAANGAPSVVQLFPDYVALDGGLPIVVDGKIVGAIGASGARGFEDAQAARAGLDSTG